MKSKLRAICISEVKELINVQDTMTSGDGNTREELIMVPKEMGLACT